MRVQKKHEKKPGKTTFLSKESIQCPVCDGSFKREELFSEIGRASCRERV